MEELIADKRNQMKTDYSENGPGAFDDSQLLEMLLFYSVPSGDTKHLAEALLNKFGSLDNLLNAGIEQMALSEDVNKKTALLLKLTADIGIRARRNSGGRCSAKSIEYAAEYFKNLLENEPDEKFAVMLLDGGNKVKYSGIISSGTVNTANVTMMKLTQLTLDNGATALIIAHNHPNGVAQPSEADVNTTILIRNFMKKLNVTLIDHIIIGADGTYSMRSDAKRAKYFSK